MINFKTPSLSDRSCVFQSVKDAGYIGSDGCFGNIFLLRHKYDIQIAFHEAFLFRYYNGEGSRKGYAFPLGNGNINNALKLIEDDAKERNRPLQFCLVDEIRFKILREYFGEKIEFKMNSGDSDYIYSAENLAKLPGNTYKKKRNHISKFLRTYNNYEIRPITKESAKDALWVEKKWLNIEDLKFTCECDEAAIAECSEDEKSRLKEFCAIEEALENIEALSMKGIILYVNHEPVGMTLGSEISPEIFDTHFEKVVGEYATNGGYAFINKLFAEFLEGVKLINREEDIGIEGLRKAKLSYYPEIILEKYFGVERL